MKLITYEDIRNLDLSASECYGWTEWMIKHKRDAILPPKISLKLGEGQFCNVMPSVIFLEDGRYTGVKVITRFPGNVPSLDGRILLVDANSGEFLALMESGWITNMRTGAVAAHSVMLLGKKGFYRIGMLGLGNTARTTLFFLAETMPDREFDVKLLKYKGQEVLFKERFKRYKNLTFTYVDSIYEVIHGAEVVISAITYTENNLCDDHDAFDEGVLLVPIHSRGFMNCDLFFDKIFGDDYGHICHFKHFSEFRSFAEVCDVVNGAAVGRENDQERILAYNIGLSIHDINFAARIYKGIEKSVGIEDFDFKTPTEYLF